MNRTTLIKTATLLGAAATGVAIFSYGRSAKAAGPPEAESGTPEAKPKPTGVTPLTWEHALPLPTAADVKGDLARNWGDTPKDLRALFVLAEEASGIAGAARILAVNAKRESAFVVTAHNGDEVDEETERAASRRAYDNNKGRNPPLAFGELAANFGSGGLFGLLAPYFLWTGVAEVGDKAPLLGSDPRIMFLPRVATFGAIVYLQRILKHYRVDDHGDIKAGWANPGLLREPPDGGRGGETYHEVRERFFADAQALGIDLGDKTTIPPKLVADAWPGVLQVWQRVVGTLPVPRREAQA